MLVEKKSRKSFLLIFLMLLTTIFACNLPGGEDQAADEQLTGEQVQSNDTSGQGVDDTEPIETDTPGEEPATEAVEEQTSITFASSDPCQIVTQEQAETAFGLAVESVIPASDASLNSCTYMIGAGEKLITVSVWEGENAKSYFINEIAQLSNDCGLSFSFSTDPEEPTPFPDEYQLLLDETIPALFQMHTDLYQACEYGAEPIPEFGRSAYSIYTFIEAGLVGIATDDMFVTFVYFDSGQDKTASLESVLELLRIIFQEN
ncbi:MAG: hypothetical protein FVQ83_04025 [Chloroflexi bacterium]|nr:hypothetical protein [Chloroflexota bacterium]